MDEKPRTFQRHPRWVNTDDPTGDRRINDLLDSWVKRKRELSTIPLGDNPDDPEIDINLCDIAFDTPKQIASRLTEVFVSTVETLANNAPMCESANERRALLTVISESMQHGIFKTARYIESVHPNRHHFEEIDALKQAFLDGNIDDEEMDIRLTNLHCGLVDEAISLGEHSLERAGSIARAITEYSLLDIAIHYEREHDLPNRVDRENLFDYLVANFNRISFSVPELGKQR